MMNLSPHDAEQMRYESRCISLRTRWNLSLTLSGVRTLHRSRVLECLLRSALELGCWICSDGLGVTVLGIAVGTELSSREWLSNGRKGA